jgi:hypothetical protein
MGRKPYLQTSCVFFRAALKLGLLSIHADLGLNQRSRVIYAVSSMPPVADQGMRNEMPLTAEPQSIFKVTSFLAFSRQECANDNEIKGFAPGRDR